MIFMNFYDFLTFAFTAIRKSLGLTGGKRGESRRYLVSSSAHSVTHSMSGRGESRAPPTKTSSSGAPTLIRIPSTITPSPGVETVWLSAPRTGSWGRQGLTAVVKRSRSVWGWTVRAAAAMKPWPRCTKCAAVQVRVLSLNTNLTVFMARPRLYEMGHTGLQPVGLQSKSPRHWPVRGSLWKVDWKQNSDLPSRIHMTHTIWNYF